MVVLYDGQYGIHNDRLHLSALGFRFVVHFPSDRITNSEKQKKGDWRWYMPPRATKRAKQCSASGQKNKQVLCTMRLGDLQGRWKEHFQAPKGSTKIL